VLTHPRQTRSFLGQVADGGLFMLALAVAYFLRAEFPLLDLPALESIADYLWLFPWVAFIGPAILRGQGFYDQPRLTSRWGIMLIIVRSCLYTVLGTILFLFLTRAQAARSVVILVGGFGGFFVYLRHELSRWGSRGTGWQRRVLWLGTPAETARAQAALTGLEREALTTIGSHDVAELDAPALIKILHRESIDAVIASLAGSDPVHLDPLFAACEEEGVELLIRPGLALSSPWRMAVDDFGGEPVLYIRAQKASPTSLAIK
jgi:hypothetical protein